MFEKFDLKWFTTVPGILTGIGCLLILISIIVFITSLFGKKKKDGDTPKENIVVNDIPNTKTEETKTVETAEVTPTTTESAIAPVEVAPVTEEPAVAPVEVTPVTEEPTVAPVEVAPVTEDPAVAPVEITPASIDIQPVETGAQPEIQPTTYEGINIEPEIKPVEERKPYGGAEITPNVETGKETPKVIYGGADPTEGTGMIPKIDNSTSQTDEIESL